MKQFFFIYLLIELWIVMTPFPLYRRVNTKQVTHVGKSIIIKLAM